MKYNIKIPGTIPFKKQPQVAKQGYVVNVNNQQFQRYAQGAIEKIETIKKHAHLYQVDNLNMPLNNQELKEFKNIINSQSKLKIVGDNISIAGAGKSLKKASPNIQSVIFGILNSADLLKRDFRKISEVV